MSNYYVLDLALHLGEEEKNPQNFNFLWVSPFKWLFLQISCDESYDGNILIMRLCSFKSPSYLNWDTFMVKVNLSLEPQALQVLFLTSSNLSRLFGLCYRTQWCRVELGKQLRFQKICKSNSIDKGHHEQRYYWLHFRLLLRETSWYGVFFFKFVIQAHERGCVA